MEEQPPPGHKFVKVTFKKPTWCETCSDFIWGLAFQGHQCTICSWTTHGGECLSRANSESQCWLRLEPKLTGKSRDKKQLLKLKKLSTIIEKDDVVYWPRIRVFLTLVVPANAQDNENEYNCFRGKPIPPAGLPPSPHHSNSAKLLPLDKHGQPLCNSSVSLPNIEPTDVLLGLLQWIQGKAIPDQIAALHILEQLMHLEENRRKIMQCEVALELAKLLVDDPNQNCLSWEVPRLILNVLRAAVEGNKEFKLKMRKYNTLGKIIKYLKDIKKRKLKDKSERAALTQAKDAGALLIYDFHMEFYDKDFVMTEYMCNNRSLSVLIEAAKRGVITLHNEITHEQLNPKFDDEHLLYSSPLCKVYWGSWKGNPVAIKVFDPLGMGFLWDGFLQEISLLSLINHPNVCPFYGACTNQEHPFLVTKLFPKGSLKNLIETEEIQAIIAKEKETARKNGTKWYNHRSPMDISLIANMCMNAANGVHYLHSKKIIHRDIKAANFLVDEHNQVYVIDFGVSRVSPDDPQEKQTIVGTPVWMAPEVMSKMPYDEKADTYSFALVVWGMLTGKAPFASVPPLSLPLQICHHKFREKIPPNVDPRLGPMIVRMWDHDPANRPNFTEILNFFYNMKDEKTGYYYCRMIEHVPDTLFVNILEYLGKSSPSVTSLAISSKRFFRLVQKWKNNDM